MIAASEHQEFVPYGRQHIKNHPGNVGMKAPIVQFHNESFLAQRFSQFSIEDNSQGEFWTMRGTKDDHFIEEELYVVGRTAVISKGTVESSLLADDLGKKAGRVLECSYSLESPIKQALWVKFMELCDKKVKYIPSLCLIDSQIISVHTESGEEFLSPLQFKISSVWPTKFGLLLERVAFCCLDKDPMCDSESLTTLFCLLHPLDEISPLLCVKYGGILAYMNDSCLKVVFTCEEPSLVLMYDIRSGFHSIWKLRQASSEECQVMCGQESGISIHTTSNNIFCSSGNVSTSSNQGSFRGSLTNKSLGNVLSTSHSSPFPGANTNSPHSSRPQSPWRSHSPMLNSTKVERELPASNFSIEARMGNSIVAPVCEPKPIVPELCIEHLWSDSSSYYRDKSQAKKAFLSNDILGQEYLCYLVSHKLVLIRLGRTNTKMPELIIGTISHLPAKDAVPIPALNMLAILDYNGSVMLYSGTNVVGKLHLGGVSTELASSLYLSSASSVTRIHSPFLKRSSLISSTKVGDALFDERTMLLSPVGPVFKDSLDNPSGRDMIKALRDPVGFRFTLEFSSGRMFRVKLSDFYSSRPVSDCVSVLRCVLQKEVAVLTLLKWYSARHSPGTQDISSNQEWELFISALLGLLGYQVDSLPLLQYLRKPDRDTPAKVIKKRRASDLGSIEDWNYLTSSTYHHITGPSLISKLLLQEVPHTPETNLEVKQAGEFNSNAPLFPYIHLIFIAFHLLYEELKLNVLAHDNLPKLCLLLHQLSSDLRLDNYSHYYWRDFPALCNNYTEKAGVWQKKSDEASNDTRTEKSQLCQAELDKLEVPAYLYSFPPSVFQQIIYMMDGEFNQIDPFPYVIGVNKRTIQILNLFSVITGKDVNVKNIVPPGSRSHSPPTEPVPNVAMSVSSLVVHDMSKMGITSDELMTFPSGILMVLAQCIQHVYENPDVWSDSVYRLVGRLDMLSQSSKDSPDESSEQTKISSQAFKLRFNKDQRVAEVKRLLNSSEPVPINITQRPDVTDHEYIEEQERHLYAICTRTMALPIGRGMMSLHTSTPVVSEPLNIPRLCLSGRAPPRGNTVELSHIEVVPNMNLWPLFHNGVAAGLKISPFACNIDSTWIVYNKPKSGTEALPEHAGFLMALGLSGHLSSLNQLNLYKYLTRCHEMTSVGLLLGLAASKRGTMDVRATKLFSVHIESLLPPTSIELDLVQNIQVAALLGIGLIYQGTAHRHIAEVLLQEIGRPPGPEMDNSSDRECYALAAGLGLGLVVLGRGSNTIGLDDLAIADTLHYYMVGGTKRPLTGSQKEKYKSPSYQIREGDCVNNHVTAPGATLALGMMYFNSGNMAVAKWLEAPDSEFLLDFICPDLLLLRILSRSLILWDHILPSMKWVESHVPTNIRRYCLIKPQDNIDNIDYETLNQAYCNIVAGACMAIGLKFAGSANAEAYSTLLYFCKLFISLSSKSIAELAGKSTIETCICVTLLSLATVMAGTGDLEVLRFCRHLRSRVGQITNSVVTYGSHLAVHMALGLLFLGGGMYTLSTTPESIAALICAFFPKFPTHSNDNRYHLQAFRHLYVLAVEPRLLLPKDIDSDQYCYAHITAKFIDTPFYSNQSVKYYAPCILPELNLLQEVRIEDERYWPIIFTRDTNWNLLVDALKNIRSIYVKQRSGCLSYKDDPHGFRTLLAQTLSTTNDASSWVISPDSITAFTSNASITNFVNSYLSFEDSCKANSAKEITFAHYLSKVTYDCVTQDRLILQKAFIPLVDDLIRLSHDPHPILLWQLKIFLTYVLRNKKETYIPVEFALCIKEIIDAHVHHWEKDVLHLVADYLQDKKIVSATSSELSKLTSYLVYHSLPLQPQFKASIPKDCANFLFFIKFLKDINLPVSTLKPLWMLIKNSNSKM